jgi:hypothetical protein
LMNLKTPKAASNSNFASRDIVTSRHRDALMKVPLK